MIISIVAESLLQNSTSFHDKNSEEARNRSNIPKQNKDYIEQISSQHHTKQDRTETISSKVRNITGMSTFFILSQYTT
jgi:hypothetical protein